MPTSRHQDRTLQSAYDHHAPAGTATLADVDARPLTAPFAERHPRRDAETVPNPTTEVAPGFHERRGSARRPTATMVRFGRTGTMDAPWAGLICDASETGILLCCEPHPTVDVGHQVTIVDRTGRWARGLVVRVVPHDHPALTHYGVSLQSVSGDLEQQFPTVARRERDAMLALLEASMAANRAIGHAPLG